MASPENTPAQGPKGSKSTEHNPFFLFRLDLKVQLGNRIARLASVPSAEESHTEWQQAHTTQAGRGGPN
jgi:hypothetical protein